MHWTEPYLALNGTDAASTSEVGGYTLYPSNQTYSYISFDVTNAARKWKEGEPNYGLLVWATNEYEAGRDIRFHSREHATRVPFMEISCAHHSASVTLEADVVCTRIGTSAYTILLTTNIGTYITGYEKTPLLLPTPTGIYETTEASNTLTITGYIQNNNSTVTNTASNNRNYGCF